jgi:uncharacterized UPF0160 family protein
MENYELITHDGKMHADEVFAIALLKILLLSSNITITRTRNQLIIEEAKQNKNAYLIDVGLNYNKNLNNYDHHQEEYKGHKSSFGLVMESFKDQFKTEFNINENAFKLFEKRLVNPIDDWDNNNHQIIQKSKTLNIVTLQQIINSFNAHNVYSLSQEKNFDEAVGLAIRMIFSEKNNSITISKQEQLILSYLKANLIQIKGNKLLSKIHMHHYQEWANENNITFLLQPVPDSGKLFQYTVISLNSDKKLPFSTKQLFKHKNGHFILFKKWNDAFEYFQNL